MEKKTEKYYQKTPLPLMKIKDDWCGSQVKFLNSISERPNIIIMVLIITDFFFLLRLFEDVS